MGPLYRIYYPNLPKKSIKQTWQNNACQVLMLGNHDAVLCLGFYAPVKKATIARNAQYAAKTYPADKNKTFTIIPFV
jgi:hypothetical protein